MKQYHVNINPKVCYRISLEGKDKADAYLFAKQLSSLSHHPILFNFKTHMTAYRLLLGLTDRKFRQLLKSALGYGFCTIEGKHLRIISKSYERRNHHVKHHYKIKAEDLKNMYHMYIIQANLNKQQKSVQYKPATASSKQGRCFNRVVGYSNPFDKKLTSNSDITLSCRSAAKLLAISIGTAHGILRKLQPYGLTVTSNTVHINKQQFRTYLADPTHHFNVRYKKETKEYLYVKANTAFVSRSILSACYIKELIIVRPEYKSFSYCNNDIV